MVKCLCPFVSTVLGGYSDRACVRHSKSTVEERGIGRSEKGTEGREVVCEGWAPGDVS